MDQGCLPFVSQESDPVDDMLEIRQAFKDTSSYNYEAEFSITFNPESLGSSNNQDLSADTESDIESDQEVAEPEEDNGQDELATRNSLTISGTSSGSAANGTLSALVQLDQMNQDQTDIWQEFIAQPTRIYYDTENIFVGMDNLDGGFAKITEIDLLNSFEFLAMTSGGINNIKKEQSGQLNKYTIDIDPQSLVLNQLGGFSNVKVVVYADTESKLPQEIDFSAQFGEGSYEIDKRFVSYNSGETVDLGVEDETEYREIAISDFADLIEGYQTNLSQRDQERKEDLSQLQSAIEAYKQENGQYPVSEDVDMIDRPDSLVAKVLSPTYITRVPRDPLFDRYFYGYVSEDGEDYTLSSVIENSEDEDAAKVNTIYLYKLKSTE
jgi:hypothetical protein